LITKKNSSVVICSISTINLTNSLYLSCKTTEQFPKALYQLPETLQNYQHPAFHKWMKDSTLSMGACISIPQTVVCTLSFQDCLVQVLSLWMSP
jgi:hypothetical protein